MMCTAPQTALCRKAFWLAAAGTFPVALLAVASSEAFFSGVFLTPDSHSYIPIAVELLEHGSLGSTPLRTLGYPLFLLPHLAMFGPDWGLRFAVVTQLCLNLAFAALAFRLVSRLAGETDVKVRLFSAGVAWLAGLNMASAVLTDSVAALLFLAAVYVLLFSKGVVRSLAGLAFIFAAGQFRPVFNVATLLLPLFLLYRVRHLNRHGWTVGLGVILGGLLSWATETAVEYRAGAQLGSESLRTANYRDMIEAQFFGAQGADVEAEINQEVTKITGTPYAHLTRSQKQFAMAGLWWRKVQAQPDKAVSRVALNFAQYLVVPIESLGLRALAYLQLPTLPYRAALGLLFAPLWLLCFLPFSWSASAARKPYWLLAWASTLLLIGLGCVAVQQGERFRLPLTPLLLPGLAWNLQKAREFWQQVRSH